MGDREVIAAANSAAQPENRHGVHFELLDGSIGRIADAHSASSHEQWRARLPDIRRWAGIRRSADWLTLTLPLRRLSQPIGPRNIDRLLRRNARLRGCARIVGQRRAGGRQFVIDMPATLVPWDEGEKLDELLALLATDLQHACRPRSGRRAAPAGAARSRDGLEAHFDEAGWPAQRHDGKGLEVPLDVHGRYFAARIHDDGDRTRLSVPFFPVEFENASSLCRGAVSVLLWLTASRLRMVKPVRSRRGLALEVVLLPDHCNATGLAHACAALSVALQRCGAEAELLLAHEQLAEAYLENLHFQRRHELSATRDDVHPDG